MHVREGPPPELGGAWQDWLRAARRELDRTPRASDAAFPHVTEGGRWRLLPVDARSGWTGDVYDHGNWTAGFWSGVMWLAALGTSDRQTVEAARSRLPQLAPQASDTTTHDLGFLFYPSFAFGRASGLLEGSALEPARAAVSSLARRFNPRGDYIQAFGHLGEQRSAGTSTIDTMMNLPLLWWAAGRGGDPSLQEVARRHARTSARVFLREDGSTYHLCRFDPLSGALLHRGTYQGASDASCWSRGQSWAICGFAWAYAATGEPELLRTADYFWERLPADGLPPWDFSDQDPAAPRDASAAAIAALGVLLLGELDPHDARRRSLAGRGQALLGQLGPSCLNREPQQDGILLRSCYSKPHGQGIDSATGWGDFYFGVALALTTQRLDLATLVGFTPQQG
jgi:unsaturated chondroitin disaccharide hydrolase